MKKLLSTLAITLVASIAGATNTGPDLRCGGHDNENPFEFTISNDGPGYTVHINGMSVLITSQKYEPSANFCSAQKMPYVAFSSRPIADGTVAYAELIIGCGDNDIWYKITDAVCYQF